MGATNGHGSHHEAAQPPITAAQSLQPELIDARELSRRWNLPCSWIREQVRSRARDPLPHLRFGRYVRFDANDPELRKWLERRRTSGNKHS